MDSALPARRAVAPLQLRAAAGAVSRSADRRDRVVDAARAGSILVVVAWHWALSVTQRGPDGDWIMPNPIHTVPGGWLATWVLQVVPVFFLAGGYANFAAWSANRRAGGSAAGFVAGRMRRLLIPAAAWFGVWLLVELVALAVLGRRGHDWVWQWFPGLVAPLWFLGVYVLITAIVPVTAELHRRHGAATLAGLVAVIVVGSVLDRAGGQVWAAWVVTAAVWLFCHQLGHLWRTADLGTRPVRTRLAVAATGLGALVALTAFAGYPRSMVAEVGQASNMLPTSAAIAALAVFQLGMIALVTPAARRLLHRPRVWAPVALVNLVTMSVLMWHMTAYLVAVTVFEALGGQLLAEPTAAWWAQRWLWVLAPAVVLVALLLAVGRVELATRGIAVPPGRALGRLWRGDRQGEQS